MTTPVRKSNPAHERKQGTRQYPETKARNVLRCHGHTGSTSSIHRTTAVLRTVRVACPLDTRFASMTVRFCARPRSRLSYGPAIASPALLPPDKKGRLQVPASGPQVRQGRRGAWGTRPCLNGNEIGTFDRVSRSLMLGSVGKTAHPDV